MLTTLGNIVRYYFTFHPCRWCVRYGGSGARTSIPKPNISATIQEQYSYQLSICSVCLERLKIALS